MFFFFQVQETQIQRCVSLCTRSRKGRAIEFVRHGTNTIMTINTELSADDNNFPRNSTPLFANLDYDWLCGAPIIPARAGFGGKGALAARVITVDIVTT